jgi:hypothetical protein
MLEECRMLSSAKKLREADKLLSSIPESNLKQVRALQAFEASMNNMFLHRYEPCSASFQAMVKLNNWSHGLYYYIAGCAHVERYRELLITEPEKAQEQGKLAEEILRKVPQHTGKKRIMARQLPFDIFVNRKLQKWEQRAQTHKIELYEAVGVSPIEEMVYFWNGYKRMQPEDLEVSLQKLLWSNSPENKIPWDTESLDEHAIQAVLQAVVLRNLGRTKEAKETLQKEILSHERTEFKGGVKDNWTCPVAHYEMGVNHWVEYGQSGEENDLIESQSWLDKAAAWEAYDLDAR